MRAIPILLSVASFFVVAQAAGYVGVRLGIDQKNMLHTAIDWAIADSSADVLFVGTSRIEYAVDPNVFDAAMASKGVRTSTHVLGIPALSFVEMEYALERTFHERPCCIKYVLMEPDLSQQPVAENPNMVRAIRFFSLVNAARYWLYLRKLPAASIALDRWTYSKNIARAVFRHYTNVGIFQTVYDSRDVLVTHQSRGYTSRSERGLLAEKMRSQPDSRRQYEAELASISKSRSAPQVADYHVERLAALVAFIQSKGAQVVLLRTPQFNNAKVSGALLTMLQARCPAGPPILDFGIPSEFPDLFAPENRLDPDHLDGPTSEQFTRMIADRFADLISSGRLLPENRARCPERL